MTTLQRLTPGARTCAALRVLSGLIISAVWWIVAPCPPAHAQEDAAVDQSSNPKAEPERITFELGSFEIREIRPTHNETTNVNFTAYLEMSPGATTEEVQQLDHWKHRLRDQVIIAVRTAQEADFLEPDLVRLRRIILFRVRRLLRANVVQDILFSEFTFKTE
jgi:flagellar basal body-associated protein FliL